MGEARIGVAALGGMALTVAALGPAAVALGGAPARPGAPVLVVTAPGRDAGAVILAAGGRLIGPATAPMAALGVLDDAAALAAASAQSWLVADGRIAAWLCSVERR